MSTNGHAPYAPKHRDGLWLGRDRPSLAADPPLVHAEHGICVGRHRAFAGEPIVEEILRGVTTAYADWSRS